MAIESFKCARHFLVCRSIIVGLPMVGQGKNFRIKVLRRLENTILRLYFIRE